MRSLPAWFTGREWDSETGLCHYRARTYDPVQGRFKQRDPMVCVDGYGLPSGMSDKPVTKVDPNGLEPFYIMDVDGKNGILAPNHTPNRFSFSILSCAERIA